MSIIPDELWPAYQDGRRAFYLDCPLGANPYSHTTQSMSADLWQHGWLSAKAEYES